MDPNSVRIACMLRRCSIVERTSATRPMLIIIRANPRGPMSSIRADRLFRHVELEEFVNGKAERNQRRGGPDPRHQRAFVREAGTLDREPGSGVDHTCHGQRPFISTTSDQLRNVRMTTSTPRIKTLSQRWLECHGSNDVGCHEQFQAEQKRPRELELVVLV